MIRLRRRASRLPFSYVLFANLQSLEYKLDELRSRLSYQRDLKSCFPVSWLNDLDNIHLFVNIWCTMSNVKEVQNCCSPEVEYLMISCRLYHLPREFIYIFCSCLTTGHTLVESTLFPCHFHTIKLNQCGIDVELTSVSSGYLPPQTDAGTKTALNELYRAINKQ